MTADDQGDLAVTVYNANLALIRDVREFTLAAGESDLHFVDVAATINDPNYFGSASGTLVITPAPVVVTPAPRIAPPPSPSDSTPR